MNIFELAVRSVRRKKARSIVLFVIVYVATVFIYAGFSCREANIQTQDSSRQAIGASFRLEINGTNRQKRLLESSKALTEQIGENTNGSLGGYNRKQLPDGSWMIWTDNSFDTLKMKDIKEISKVSGISDYNVTTANTVVHLVNARRIEDPDVDQTSDQGGVSLRGNRDMRLDFDVQKGNIEVTEGRLIGADDENVCIISRELADVNSLKIGDVLAFNDWKKPDTAKVIEAEIIGIYDSINGITPITRGDSYRAENIIFTDLSLPEKAEGCEGDPLYQYAVFQVADVDKYEIVKNRMAEVDIDWEYYDLLDNSGISETMAENFSGLKSMSEVLLILVIVLAVFVLFFIFLFWMKNRIHEIGILLSLGESKMKIVLQMLIEGILISGIAFVLATASAGAVSNMAADYLVGNQIELDREKEEADAGMVEMSEEETKSEVIGVAVGISGNIIAYTAISVIGIILLAVGFSSISVAIQKPKNILSKMS